MHFDVVAVFRTNFWKIGLGRCLSGQNFEICLRTKKPKMGEFWQRHLAGLSRVLALLAQFSQVKLVILMIISHHDQLFLIKSYFEIIDTGTLSYITSHSDTSTVTSYGKCFLYENVLIII
jgi:hypothetical protein